MDKNFSELKKNCKKDMSQFRPHRLALLGDHATQLFAVCLRGYGYEEKLNIEVFDAEYNQIQAQIIDRNSELYEFNPETTLISMCTEKLYESFCATPVEKRDKFSQNIFYQIKNLWVSYQNNLKTPIFQFTFAQLDDRVFCSYATKLSTSFLYQVNKLNMLLFEESQSSELIYCIDINYIYMNYGISQVFDERLYYSSKITVSTKFLPALSQLVVDFLKVRFGLLKKCVICDLDNTLWGGVIGDDGLEGIEIGELGVGHAFTDFQLWLKELKNRGIILAICSKNEETTAKLPFEEHPEMILSLDDISVFRANWDDKVSNIREIQRILNISFDSMVFLDDNIFERNAVKELIPDIFVPELPKDPAHYLRYIKEQNLFETSSYSNADLVRTQQYQAEAEREELLQAIGTYDDYLMSLEMVATVSPFDTFHIPRISQLTQRSNQFNLRTTRYSELEIKELAENDDFVSLYFLLKDKFGDHGLVSVLILEKKEGYLFVETWLMSCRVLKRGMEEFVVNQMINTAKKLAFSEIRGEWLPTPKNNMVKDLYKKMGFSKVDNNNFVMNIEDYQPKKVFIEMVDKRSF